MYRSAPHRSSRFNRRRLLGLSAAAFATPVFLNRASSRALAQDGEDTAFFDSSVVHTVSVTFDQEAYDAMIQTYRDSGDKEWIEATVTIDASTYDRVGMRLKGNSSLMGIRQSSGGAAPGGATAEQPESLPWLVRLDEYVNDQHHDGIEQFVIRSNNSRTSMNEAVALDLLATAGLASQKAAATTFSVNGSSPWLRLAIENPRTKWMEAHFPANGILYKSEAEGDWSFQGEEYAAYTTAFDLEAGDTGDDAADYAPLIGFLDFLNNSDDSAFTSELPDRLDVDQFITYLAMMELVSNFDDIDGPGNNSYLYYGAEAQQFTVVPWDMNLAFGGMGGGGQFGGGQPPEGFDAGELPVTDGGFDPSATPVADGFPMWDGSGTPPAFPAMDGMLEGSGSGTPPASGDRMMLGGPGGRANPLVLRFNANADWTAQLETRMTTLRDDLYASGVAADFLARWVGTLEAGASDLVPQETIAAESDAIAAFFTVT